MEWVQFTILIGCLVGLFFLNRYESHANVSQIADLLDRIQSEMKDFHGRLERQDAEFKAHMICFHEERTRK